jgi:hypothetical protein
MAVNFQKIVATNVIETIDKQFVTNAEKTAIANLGTASSKDTGTSAGNVPVLDGTGKLSGSILPDLAITDVFVVASEVEMLALSTAKTGDVVIRTDIEKTYILATLNYATLTDWKELTVPHAPVSSVAGKTGVVTLDVADISGLSTTLSGKIDSSTLSTDNTLGGVSASDTLISSQKAVKSYVDTVISGLQSGGITNLSSITETLVVSTNTVMVANSIKGISLVYVVDQGIIQGNSFSYTDKTITFSDTTLNSKSVQVTYMY